MSPRKTKKGIIPGKKKGLLGLFSKRRESARRPPAQTPKVPEPGPPPPKVTKAKDFGKPLKITKPPAKGKTVSPGDVVRKDSRRKRT